MCLVTQGTCSIGAPALARLRVVRNRLLLKNRNCSGPNGLGKGGGKGGGTGVAAGAEPVEASG